MYKVPVSVLKECLANLEAFKEELEFRQKIHKYTGLKFQKTIERKLKNVKSNIKLLKTNYQI